MAGKRNTEATPPREKTLTKYHIARVGRKVQAADGGGMRTIPAGAPLVPGDTLTIVATDVEGKTGLDAADAAVNDLPEDERGGEFGAFTARNFSSDEWETEALVITRRKSQA